MRRVNQNGFKIDLGRNVIFGIFTYFFVIILNSFKHQFLRWKFQTKFWTPNSFHFRRPIWKNQHKQVTVSIINYDSEYTIRRILPFDIFQNFWEYEKGTSFSLVSFKYLNQNLKVVIDCENYRNDSCSTYACVLYGLILTASRYSFTKPSKNIQRFSLHTDSFDLCKFTNCQFYKVSW